jgi:glycosyltransferase involved in cell wall biosynthesis
MVLSPLARGSRYPNAPASRDSAHLSLLRSGYDRVWMHSDRKRLCISAQRVCAAPAIRTCSILVPVFNEKDTFPELMRTLLAKRLDHLGLEREIILIESNSSDGTRELVAGFAATPGVRVIYQDHPRGKGHAVRAGLAVATGDIVLIQDADLEYDLNDYDALLEPLLSNRAAFVLGCRHGGRFRMRKFPQQRLLGDVLNIAHVLLATLINVLYRQTMKDPFTMFKVFRRDCLYGLEFECNGFDFDHELVIKLVLKGYRPLEIPVNYCARSFSQGKKIRLFRDPPALIAADLKYRLRRLRPRFE